jgi:peptide/nickel transport system substrate-binding protein
MKRILVGIFCAVATLAVTGCGGCLGPAGTAAPTNFVLGDLVDPFAPPTLEELDDEVTWVDRPVLDSMELLREKLAAEAPLATVEEALALRNESPEDNDRIKSGLGRLPESDGDVNWDATMNRHSYVEVNSTNPILASSVAEFDVSGLTGFGLFSFDWEFNAFASKDSVKSWQSSEDGLYDKVVMRDDLTWSDGHPITAHDVVFSYRVIMSSAVPVPAQRTGTDKLRWVEAYDDHTLVFFHKEPLVTNVWNLSFSVVPKHVYENTIAADPSMKTSREHTQIENSPVVGGPYEIRSRTRGNEIVLGRRESYFMHNGKQVRDIPHFKTVRFRIRENVATALLTFKSGDVDEIQLTPEQWHTQTSDSAFYTNATKAYATEWTSFHFVWNMTKPFFSDKKVRQAMSYAFDHEEMLSKLRYGLDEPSTGIFHPTSRWSPKPAPEPIKQDLRKAAQLLDEAGWIDDDGDGIREKTISGRKVKAEFTVIVVNKDDRIAICQLLKDSLDQIGVRCNIQPLEFTVQIDRLQRKEFDAAFGGWGTGADPDTSENIWGSNQQRNYAQYSNPEVDKLFEEGRKEFDLDKRAEKYQRIAEILWDDQPYTWLFYQNSYYGFNRSLRGYNFSPRGPYNYGPGFSAIWKPAVP